jgi:peptidoglycan/LPS O-acetylase OafA/YrhL
MKKELTNNHYPQLDVFRALAALSVCAVHFNFNSYFHKNLANGIFVQLFFTLSGFVIYLNYYNKINNTHQLTTFLKKRLKRLYPLHLFFLIIFLIIETLKHYISLKYNLEANNKSFTSNNLENFFLNLFFLQHFASEYSFNTPSWSISVEMMLYVTLGILLFLIKKQIIKFLLIYIILFIIFLHNFYGFSLGIEAYLSGLYSFSIGVIFAYIFLTKKIFIKDFYLSIIFIILLFFSISEIFYFKIFYKNYYYSILFAFIFFVSCLLKKKSLIQSIFFNKLFIFLGKISYSIYLSHLLIFWTITQILRFVIKYPIININGKNILDLNNLEANLFTFLAYILTIFFSYFSYKYIEIRFYKK